MNHYTFEQLYVGMEESFETQITESMMEAFYQLSGDENPLHREADFARKMGYEGRVVYGLLTTSLFSTLAGTYLPGEFCVIHRVETEFPKPVYVDDTLRVTGKVQELNEAFRTAVLKVTVTNQNGSKVCRGKIRVGFLQNKGEESESCI